MKHGLWCLSLWIVACHAAHGQDAAPSTPRTPAATLVLPRPSSSNATGLVPAKYNDALLPAGIGNAPAPDPVSPTPYRYLDGPQVMPKPEEGTVLPKPVPNVAAPAAGVPGLTSSAIPGLAPPCDSAPLCDSAPPECCDPDCPLPLGAAPLLYGDRFRLTAEYLMWWTSGFHAPPLVTTGPATSDGIIGQPGVATLAGNERVSPTFRSGARFGGEWFFGPRQVWGLDGHFFFLGTNTSNEGFNSNQYPLLARPFFNVNQNIPFSEIVASPGLLTGAVNIHTSTALWGADMNVRRRLLSGCTWNFDAFAGYRYVRLSEQLSIQEAVFAAPGASALSSSIPANFVAARAFDSFKTTNQFNGGQVGLYFEKTTGRWVVSLRPSIAVGETSSTLDIAGGQVNVFTTGVTSTPGGLLALNSNSGHYTKNSFAVVPEATFNIGYNVTDHCRLFVGYNMLYWSSVLRPGAQVNPNLDVNRIPGFPATTPASTVTPTPSLKDQSFWAQGVNFGLMFRW